MIEDEARRARATRAPCRGHNGRMRAARLIRMVLLLQSRPAMTAAELAHELQVSERTVTRDAQALSEAGIPVYAERGRAAWVPARRRVPHRSHRAGP